MRVAKIRGWCVAVLVVMVIALAACTQGLVAPSAVALAEPDEPMGSDSGSDSPPTPGWLSPSSLGPRAVTIAPPPTVIVDIFTTGPLAVPEVREGTAATFQVVAKGGGHGAPTVDVALSYTDNLGGPTLVPVVVEGEALIQVTALENDDCNPPVTEPASATVLPRGGYSGYIIESRVADLLIVDNDIPLLSVGELARAPVAGGYVVQATIESSAVPVGYNVPFDLILYVKQREVGTRSELLSVSLPDGATSVTVIGSIFMSDPTVVAAYIRSHWNHRDYCDANGDGIGGYMLEPYSRFGKARVR